MSTIRFVPAPEVVVGSIADDYLKSHFSAMYANFTAELKSAAEKIKASDKQYTVALQLYRDHQRYLESSLTHAQDALTRVNLADANARSAAIRAQADKNFEAAEQNQRIAAGVGIAAGAHSTAVKVYTESNADAYAKELDRYQQADAIAEAASKGGASNAADEYRVRRDLYSSTSSAFPTVLGAASARADHADLPLDLLVAAFNEDRYTTGTDPDAALVALQREAATQSPEVQAQVKQLANKLADIKTRSGNEAKAKAGGTTGTRKVLGDTPVYEPPTPDFTGPRSEAERRVAAAQAALDGAPAPPEFHPHSATETAQALYAQDYGPKGAPAGSRAREILDAYLNDYKPAAAPRPSERPPAPPAKVIPLGAAPQPPQAAVPRATDVPRGIAPLPAGIPGWQVVPDGTVKDDKGRVVPGVQQATPPTLTPPSNYTGPTEVPYTGEEGGVKLDVQAPKAEDIQFKQQARPKEHVLNVVPLGAPKAEDIQFKPQDSTSPTMELPEDVIEGGTAKADGFLSKYGLIAEDGKLRKMKVQRLSETTEEGAAARAALADAGGNADAAAKKLSSIRVRDPDKAIAIAYGLARQGVV